MSKDHGCHREAEARKSDNEFLNARKRKCHDCGKPTWNYRCRECDAKHKQKHGVMLSVSDAED